ncbi:DNA-binding LacI/PurR family transcriptional regulator [Streptomyces canus]
MSPWPPGSPRYASILRGVEEAARTATHAVGVGVLESADEAAVAAEVQRAADVSGGLIVIAYDPAGVRALEAVPAGVPVVGVVETPVDAPSGDLPWVWTDAREAAHRVTRHLLSLGHETVHHVAIPSSTRRTGARTEGRRQGRRPVRLNPLPCRGVGDPAAPTRSAGTSPGIRR